jgi:hypothetical protein
VGKSPAWVHAHFREESAQSLDVSGIAVQAKCGNGDMLGSAPSAFEEMSKGVEIAGVTLSSANSEGLAGPVGMGVRLFSAGARFFEQLF